MAILFAMAKSTADAELLEVAESMFSLLAVALRHGRREISLTAASTLAVLERSSAQRISELAASEGVTQPSMTALVNRLEEAGLVERSADPSDGRAVLVSLSAAGRAYRRQRQRAGAERLVHLIEKLPVGERQVLVAAGDVLAHLGTLSEREMTGGA